MAEVSAPTPGPDAPTWPVQVELFLARLRTLDGSGWRQIRPLRKDTRIYATASKASEERGAAQRDLWVHARTEAETIVRSHAAASLSSWQVELVEAAAADAASALVIGHTRLRGYYFSRLYGPFDPVLPNVEVLRAELASRGLAGPQPAQGVPAERARTGKPRSLELGRAAAIFGDEYFVIGLGLVIALGTGLPWLGAMYGAFGFLVLKWGVGSTHAYRRIARWRDLDGLR